MIYSEPVVYEIPLLMQPTLFIMGENDRNAPGRPFAPEALRPRMGDNAQLARDLAGRMPRGRAEGFEGIGHLVQLEAAAQFNASLLSFLSEQR